MCEAALFAPRLHFVGCRGGKDRANSQTGGEYKDTSLPRWLDVQRAQRSALHDEHWPARTPSCQLHLHHHVWAWTLLLRCLPFIPPADGHDLPSPPFRGLFHLRVYTCSFHSFNHSFIPSLLCTSCWVSSSLKQHDTRRQRRITITRPSSHRSD